MSHPNHHDNSPWARGNTPHPGNYGPQQPPAMPQRYQPTQFPTVQPAYYNQAPVNHGAPAPEQGPGKKERRFGWPTRIAATAGVIAMGFGIKYGVKAAVHHEIESAVQPDKSNSAQPFPSKGSEGNGGTNYGNPEAAAIASIDTNHDGIIERDELLALKTPEQAKQAAYVPAADLVEAFEPDFVKWRQDTLDGMKKKNALTPEQLATIKFPDESIPKEQWDNQMIMTALMLDKADATSQDPAQLGYLMLPAVEDHNSSGFTEDQSLIGTGNYALNVYDGSTMQRKLTKDSFLGIPISKNARIILAALKPNPAYTKPDQPTAIWMLVDLQSGTKGKTQQWRQLGEWNARSADQSLLVETEIGKQ